MSIERLTKLGSNNHLSLPSKSPLSSSPNENTSFFEDYEPFSNNEMTDSSAYTSDDEDGSKSCAQSFIKYDVRKYNMDGFNQVLKRNMEIEDSENLLKGGSSEIPKKSAFAIEELTLESRQNFYKYNSYESTDADPSKEEQKLTISGLLETNISDPSQFPNHVRQGLKIITQDFVIAELNRKNKDLYSIVHERMKSKSLGEVDFDIDIETDLSGITQPFTSITNKIKKYKEQLTLKNSTKESDSKKKGSSASPLTPLTDKSSPLTPNTPSLHSPETSNASTPLSPAIPTLDFEKQQSDSEMQDSSEDSLQLISTKSSLVTDRLSSFQEDAVGFKRSNFILETYEEMYSLLAARKEVHMNHDRYDLLLNRFAMPADDEEIMHIVLEPKRLDLQMLQNISQPFESLVCSVSFFEMVGTVPVKVSETFRFELGYTEYDNENTRALFHIKKTENKLFLLFKLSRTFKGEFTEQINEMYLKGDKLKEKDVQTLNSAPKQKLFKSVQDVHSVFAWSCIAFSDALNPIKTITSLTNLFICDKRGDVQDEKLVALYALQDPSKRPRLIPGKFDILLKQLEGPLHPKRVVPKSFELMIERDKKMVPASEIHTLDLSRKDLLDLTNLMYIYPQSFIGNHASVKNVQVIVSYHKNDKAPKKEGERNFFYYFSFNPNDLVTQGFTQVSVRNKTPEFSDEIKCKIPSTVADGHHLLFRFYNVAHKESLVTKNGVKEFVGYAFLPLLDKSRRLISGDFDLDVYTAILQDDYMQNTDRAKVEKSFRVRIFSNSISYPQGDSSRLFSFFNMVDTSSRQSSEISKMLQTADGLLELPDVYHTLYPIVFNQLFEMLNLPGVTNLVLKILMDMVEKYRLENAESLSTYVKYHFRLDISEQLIFALQLFLEENSYDLDLLLQNLWFLFSVLIKSMIIRADSVQKESGNVGRAFSSAFYENLESLAKTLISILERCVDSRATKSKKLNLVFASFLRHSLSLLDKSFVVRVAVRYVDSMNLISRKHEESVADFQLMFFKEIFDYEGYLQLFQPLCIEEYALAPHETFSQNNHFMFSLFVDTVIKFLCNNSRVIRMKAIVSLREFIMKLSFDARYQSPAHYSRANTLLFEFVVKFLDVLNEWRTICDRERKLETKTLADLQKKLAQTSNKIDTKRETLKNCIKNEREVKTSKSSHSSMQHEIKNLETTKAQLVAMIAKHETELKKYKEQTREEKRQLFSCIAHIIENMSQDVLKQFCTAKKEHHSSKISMFLIVLQLCLQAFEYQGYKFLCDYYTNQFRSLIESGTRFSDSFDDDELMMLSNMHVATSFPSLSSLTDPKTVQSMNSLRSRRGTVNLLTGGLFGNNKPPVKQKPRGPRLGLGLDRLTSFTNVSADPTPTTERKVLKPSFRRASWTNSSDLMPSIIPTKGQDAFVTDHVKNEQHLSEHLSIVAFKCLLMTIQENASLINREDDPSRPSPLLENILRILLNFLHLNQSKRVYDIILPYLRCFFSDNRAMIFSSESKYGPLFAEAIMCLCNSNIEEVRKSAIGVLYLIIRFSFEVNGGNIDYCQVMSILSLSRTLQYTVPVGNYLRVAIENISKYAYLDHDAPGSKRWSTKFGKLNTDPQLPMTGTPRHVGPASPPVRAEPTQKTFHNAFQFFKNIETKTQEKETGKKIIEKMATFAEDVEQLGKDLQNLLRDTIAINETKQTDEKHPHKTEELFYRISQLYAKIPELRDEWIIQLAEYHRQKSQHAEAAQCYLRVLACVFDTLQKHNSPMLVNLPISDFFKLSPNIATRNFVPVSDDGVPPIPPHAWEFTEKGVIKLLMTTIDLLEMAEQFEMTIPLFKILLPLFEKEDDWSSLSETYQHMHIIYEQIDKSNKEKSRLYPTYYRLRFYGPWEGDLNGKEYVYKMPKLTKLHQMTKHVQHVFGDDIEMITNPKRPDLSAYDPNKRLLQLTSVKPYIQEEEEPTSSNIFAAVLQEPAIEKPSTTFSTIRRARAISKAAAKEPEPLPVTQLTLERKTEFQKHTNINQFYYETAFSKGAKLSEKATEIYKRKVIITVENHFPHVKTRLAVAKEVEIVLTPIEAAIENIVQQNNKLEETLKEQPVDLQNLQMVLSGSVRASVNGGPRDIVESFLHKEERSNYDIKHVQRLNEKCHIFLKLCEIGTKILEKLGTAKQRQFYVEIEKGFVETKKLFSDHLTPLPANHEIKQLTMIHELWKKSLGQSTSRSSTVTPRSKEDDMTATPHGAPDLIQESSLYRLSIPHHKFQMLSEQLQLPVLGQRGYEDSF